MRDFKEYTAIELKAQAVKIKVVGAAKMNKEDLVKALRKDAKIKSLRKEAKKRGLELKDIKELGPIQLEKAIEDTYTLSSLTIQAKKLGVLGYTTMSKKQLLKSIENHIPMTKLKDMAKEAQIPGYTTMDRKELHKVLKIK